MAFDFKIDSDLSGLRALKKNVNTLKKRHIKAGWIEAKKYSAATDNKGLYIAQVAFKHEYGVGVPQRAYFRQAIEMMKVSHTGDINTLFKEVVAGRPFVTQLEKLSNELKEDYILSVARQNMLPLSRYTIFKKGHAIQMIETGEMMRNFKSKVYRIGMNTDSE